ncbi:hypothetical protein [Nocardia asteroides]|uniref:hypothetical protein n=1 Tax=Nocardia asteroides TaxID=1824 RepID=UPI003431D151
MPGRSGARARWHAQPGKGDLGEQRSRVGGGLASGADAVAEAGAAGGALQTMQQTGGALGLAILVTVFGTAAREAGGSPTHALVGGMTAAFGAAACIAALTFVVALTFRSLRSAA